MKELMALSAGLPTIFQDREDVAAGKPCDGSATARPRWRWGRSSWLDRTTS